MNKSQEELLDSFISVEGCYFETIIEDQSINLGIKLLYLERAITQNCTDFNLSLDKLYRNNLVGEDRQTRIELIRAFKVVNDICFNNQVKFDNYGIRPALVHYFGMLGEVHSEPFTLAIHRKIHFNIAAIIQGQSDPKAPLAQKLVREHFEKDIQPHHDWRQELDLPLIQRGVSDFSSDSRPRTGAELAEVFAAIPNDVTSLDLSPDDLGTIPDSSLTSRSFSFFFPPRSEPTPASSEQQFEEGYDATIALYERAIELSNFNAM